MTLFRSLAGIEQKVGGQRDAQPITGPDDPRALQQRVAGQLGRQQRLQVAQPEPAAGTLALQAERLRRRLLRRQARPEEHTYELQSIMRSSYDVFCLKKQTYNVTIT